MALNPSSRDIQKLHLEINQIMNQRFLITATAVSIFGIMAAQALQGNSSGSGIKIDRLGIVSVAINLVLLFLSLLHLLLRKYARILTSYLNVSGNSGWEREWKKFRSRRRFLHRYIGYDTPQFLVFLILFVLTLFYPIVVSVAQTLEQNPTLSVRALPAEAFLPDRLSMNVLEANVLLFAIFLAIRFVLGSLVGGEEVYDEWWQRLADEPVEQKAVVGTDQRSINNS